MTARTRKRSIDQVRRDAAFAELRSKGLTYPQIADEKKCAVSTAYDAVQRAIADVPLEAVTALRQIEANRLDAIIAKLWDIVGDEASTTSDRISALGGILRTSESKRKLFGLDAPARQTITVITEDAIDDELRRLEEQVATRAAIEMADAQT